MANTDLCDLHSRDTKVLFKARSVSLSATSLIQYSEQTFSINLTAIGWNDPLFGLNVLTANSLSTVAIFLNAGLQNFMRPLTPVPSLPTTH